MANIRKITLLSVLFLSLALGSQSTLIVTTASETLEYQTTPITPTTATRLTTKLTGTEELKSIQTTLNSLNKQSYLCYKNPDKDIYTHEGKQKTFASKFCDQHRDAVLGPDDQGYVSTIRNAYSDKEDSDRIYTFGIELSKSSDRIYGLSNVLDGYGTNCTEVMVRLFKDCRYNFGAGGTAIFPNGERMTYAPAKVLRS